VNQSERPSSWLERRTARIVERRRVFPALVGATALTAVAAGAISHLIDKKDFPTFGIGVWWSIVTLATVGYGDVVPHTAWGRVVGSVVIIFGVTFISFLIAIVTSLFVDSNRAEIEQDRQAKHRELQALLANMDARLGAIEKQLASAPGADRP
jgi:voltage-gated potassium channel